MRLSQLFEKAWYKRFSWVLLLLPLSWIFCCVAFLRKAYIKRYASNPKLNVPVIVVGNISVGGTGKTPLLISLVQWFQQQGYRPGVVSRGYSGLAPEYPFMVSQNSSALEAGDEPLLLAGYCPVMVDPDRYRAAKALLKKTDCDLIISDDGLQHYRLPRDVEVVVVDAERGFGNGQCLPAGPLRDPVSRLIQVDFIITNGSHPGSLRKDSVLKDSFKLSIVPTQLRHLPSNDVMGVEQGIDTLIEQGRWSGGRKVHAVAGIGNPQRFVKSLEQLGFEVELHIWPDHHGFSGQEFIFDDDLPVIITAKDAVKCLQEKNEKVWVLDVSARPEDAFLEALGEKLRECKSNGGC